MVKGIPVFRWARAGSDKNSRVEPAMTADAMSEIRLRANGIKIVKCRNMASKGKSVLTIYSDSVGDGKSS
jgi:hypothetical protein